MSLAAPQPRVVSVRVPAKVNLQLGVGPLREDGFHSLSTIFQAVAIHDVVTVRASPQWQVLAAGPLAEHVPTDEGNLAIRAAKLVAEVAGVSDESLAVTIHKDIPVAGGMAGGSADAAAALVAADLFWETDLPRERLVELARQLGSDVPFALFGGNAVGTGRGDQLAPVLARPGVFHWVFAMSARGLPTPSVFAECDRLRRQEHGPDGHRSAPEPEVSTDVLTALRGGYAEDLGQALTNDLEPAAFSLRPELRDLRDAGLELGALGAVVSGSGPTVAFLVRDRAAALDLSVGLTAGRLADDVRWSTGPVHGAHAMLNTQGW